VELSLSTFILELINFLVLVWILKRLLYRPVLDIIARRRASIDETMAEAKRIETDAQALRQKYNERLEKWEEEQAEARGKLARNLDEERKRQLAQLRTSLDQEIEKSRASEDRRLTDLGHKLEQQGLTLGARFATRLLAAAAAPELQSSLLAKFLDDFDATPRDSFVRLLGSPDLPPDSVEISSAFALTDEQQQALAERSQSLCGDGVRVRFHEDPELLAGIRLKIGGCVLGLNLKDELDGFARLRDVAA
jgi:F-type H+-transporting ATPase subunit b